MLYDAACAARRHEDGPALTHSWLFTGPPGAGRSTAALAFAASLVCTNDDVVGCGHCDACRAALGGSHPDVTHVVPQELTLRVSEVRDLIKVASTLPTEAPWRVLIIEDADRLRNEGANAFLKTVEEPPARTIIVLCAPSTEDMVVTLRSRCRHVYIPTPSVESVARVLMGQGVAQAPAMLAASATNQHIGRARHLATTKQAQVLRAQVLNVAELASTCLYCSFTSYPLTAWKTQVDAYLDALEKELDYVAAKNYHRRLNSIYIGGGTPTTLEPYQLDRLIRKIRCSFDLGDCLEFTVEAGRPDSITEEKLLVLRKNGISRISINPQTMKQKTLDLIGRHHTVEQTIESFRMARKLGFDNINMDLIMGLPEENLADVRNTMEILKELDPDNITIHSLAIKRAARLNIFKDRYESMMMVNTQEHMDLCAEYCHQMGLSPYYLYRQKGMAGNMENVGYAKPGKAGVYNVLIMEERQTIVACGAGASTKRVWPQPNADGTHRIERCENVKDVGLYMKRIDEMIARKQQLFSEK